MKNKNTKNSIILHILIIISLITLFSIISVIPASATTGTTDISKAIDKDTGKAKKTINDIDFSSPITAVVKGSVDIDTFIVEYEGIEFKTTLFGIDMVKELKKDGEIKKDYDKEHFTELKKSNYITIEVDSNDNKLNKNNEIQAWIWVNGKLYQGELISKGLAIIDSDLCKYSSCDKYYSILKSNQETAKKSLKGMWGSNDYELNYNIGGKQNSMLENLIKNPIFWGSCVAVLVAIIVIVIVICKKKKSKKTSKKDKEIKSTLITVPLNNVEAENKIEKELVEQKTINEDKELERYLDEQEKLTKEALIKKATEVKEKLEEEIKERRIEEKEIVLDDLMQCYSKGVKDKTILLNLISTQFSPKDIRSKEVAETIKAEIIVVDDELNSEKFSYFVKPTKYPKLSSYCKERTDVTQINVNSGISFKNLIDNLIKLLEDCENVYSWGRSSYLQLQKEAMEKLDIEQYKKLISILNTKYVNYKEDFAERNEITPCSLVKAADLSDQTKEKDAVDTMLNIYRIERM